MGKVKNYIMEVEEFVDGYFDHETETFTVDIAGATPDVVKQKILLDVRGKFKDTLAVEIAKEYIENDMENV